MLKRIFFAIPLSQKDLDNFEKCIKKIGLDNARWMPPENWHITVLFMGDVQETLIPEIVNEAQALLDSIKPFSLKFKQIIFAPPQDPTRMIWAEYENSEQHNLLSSMLGKKLKRFILEDTSNNNASGDSKKIIPHVTLARLVKANNFVPCQLPQPKIDDLHVHTIQLIESQLMPQGSIYTQFYEFRLV